MWATMHAQQGWFNRDYSRHFSLLTQLVEQGHSIDHTVKQWHYGNMET